jgi:methanogenic corrinoid protein MtbC1
MALTIGAVSTATGVAVNTLRTWERRYGFPAPARSDGGQRLYAESDVARLKLVARALERGHRPRQVVPADEATLRQLLGTVSLAQRRRSAPQPSDSYNGGQDVDRWLAAARALDGDALRGLFQSDLSRLGVMPFLTTRAAPFLAAVGQAWHRGDLQIYQEHFATDLLARFLVSVWRPLSETAQGPTVVCGTLPGETHTLGLQMAALVLALSGRRVVLLERPAPVSELALCVQESDASALALSVTAPYPTQRASDHLRALRGALPDHVALVIGGAGAPTDVPGVLHLAGLDLLDEWARGELS